MLKEIERLAGILDDVQKQKTYACIQDLLSNGVVPERFKVGESLPSRQDVTRFIVTWLKYIGVPADGCRDWMIRYCVRELSRISSSSPSRIRHSTKSLIKYIYGSEEVSLVCGCEQNELKATCNPDCPVYGEMKNKHEERKKRLRDGLNYVRPPIQPPVEPYIPVRKRYEEQFAKAMDVVREHVNQQVSSLDEMTRHLNDQGYKTRNGKSWKTSTLRYEIKKHNLQFRRKVDERVRAYGVLKEQYRAQYQDGVKLMAGLFKEGAQISDILDMLEAQGYKTITGRKWTESNVRTTISKFLKQ